MKLDESYFVDTLTTIAGMPPEVVSLMMLQIASWCPEPGCFACVMADVTAKMVIEKALPIPLLARAIVRAKDDVHVLALVVDWGATPAGLAEKARIADDLRQLLDPLGEHV